MDDLRALYQQVILDHSRNPRHFAKRDQAQMTQSCYNPLCGDEIQIYCDYDDTQDVFKTLTFTGKGCAISIASASLMVLMMQKKPKSYFKSLFQMMHYLLDTSNVIAPDLNDPAAQAKLEVLAGVKHYPSRVKCATCAWHTLSAVVQGEKTTVKTE